MKKIILGLLLSMSALASAMPQPQLKDVLYSTQLNKFSLDPQDERLSNVVAGLISLDLTNKTIKLVLTRKWTCPVGQLCIMSMPAPVIVELPLTDVSTNECNESTFVAYRNLMPVDGMQESLVVSDYSRTICPEAFQDSTSVVYKVKYYDRLNHQLKKLKSEMSGEVLSFSQTNNN